MGDGIQVVLVVAMSRLLIYAALIAAVLWGVNLLDASRQEIGYDKARAEYTAAALKSEQAARTKEQALQSQLKKAQDDAKIRETKLAADAGRARSAADGLRDQLATNNAKLSRLTRDAVNQYANTANLVLIDCQRDYQGLAEKADAAVSDIELLRQAWPK